MKYHTQITLVVFAFLLLPFQSSAFCVTQFAKDPVLIATLGKKIVEFKIGSYVSIVYSAGSKKVKGRLVKINQDSIFLQSQNNKSNITSIPISDISSVIKLHKKGRKGWIAILSVLVLLTIVGLIFLKLNNSLALIALGVPVVSLYTFIPFLLGTFLADLLSKKSLKKGWIFSYKT